MNPDIEEALEYDGLAEAEKVTGKSYKDCEVTSALGVALSMKHNQKKEALLFLSRDTSMGAPLAQQLAVIEDLGFELLVEGEIPPREDDRTEGGDKWMIFWRKGILLFLDTYFGGQSLNSGNIYFNYKGPRSALKGCSSSWVKTDEQGAEDYAPDESEMVWSASFDVREGLRNVIERMEEAGEILEEWKGRAFLWLLHYNDTKDEDYSYDAINESRLKLLPEHVIKAIQVEQP